MRAGFIYLYPERIVTDLICLQTVFIAQAVSQRHEVLIRALEAKKSFTGQSQLERKTQLLGGGGENEAFLFFLDKVDPRDD